MYNIVSQLEFLSSKLGLTVRLINWLTPFFIPPPPPLIWSGLCIFFIRWHSCYLYTYLWICGRSPQSYDGNLSLVLLDHLVDVLGGNCLPHTRLEITVHCHRGTSNPSCTWLLVSVEFQIPQRAWGDHELIIMPFVWRSLMLVTPRLKG